MSLHVAILAGGRGERFWPLSRRTRPKQFLPLAGSRSLLQETADRLVGWVDPGSLWVVAHDSLLAEIRRQLKGALAEERCIKETRPRNTAAAIGIAAAAVEAAEPDAHLLVLPSDHWIPDTEAFRQDVQRALAAAEALDGLHLFGIPITRPECGYGYVEQADEIAGRPGVARVKRFREKPDRERAIEYARRPEMLWNSGIFLWRAATILEALGRHIPESRDALAALRDVLQGERGRLDAGAVAEAMDRYLEASPSAPIDTAVLEKHDRTYVTRASFRWSDLGGWLSWGEQIDPDSEGNRCRGLRILRDAHGCTAYSEDGLLALLGVKDLVVVRLQDVTLVCAKERAQEIRQLVREAAEQGDLDAYL